MITLKVASYKTKSPIKLMDKKITRKCLLLSVAKSVYIYFF